MALRLPADTHLSSSLPLLGSFSQYEHAAARWGIQFQASRSQGALRHLSGTNQQCIRPYLQLIVRVADQRQAPSLARCTHGLARRPVATP